MPLPQDGYLAGGMEYAALALALGWAEGRSTFVIGEVGAGWGPWVSAGSFAALRNRIERCFNKLKHFGRFKLKHFGRFATRYDRLTRHFLAFTHLARATIWMQ
jgi:transposase